MDNIDAIDKTMKDREIYFTFREFRSHALYHVDLLPQYVKLGYQRFLMQDETMFEDMNTAGGPQNMWSTPSSVLTADILSLEDRLPVTFNPNMQYIPSDRLHFFDLPQEIRNDIFSYAYIKEEYWQADLMHYWDWKELVKSVARSSEVTPPEGSIVVVLPKPLGSMCVSKRFFQEAVSFLCDRSYYRSYLNVRLSFPDFFEFMKNLPADGLLQYLLSTFLQGVKLLALNMYRGLKPVNEQYVKQLVYEFHNLQQINLRAFLPCRTKLFWRTPDTLTTGEVVAGRTDIIHESGNDCLDGYKIVKHDRRWVKCGRDGLVKWPPGLETAFEQWFVQRHALKELQIMLSFWESRQQNIVVETRPFHSHVQICSVWVDDDDEILDDRYYDEHGLGCVRILVQNYPDGHSRIKWFSQLGPWSRSMS